MSKQKSFQEYIEFLVSNLDFLADYLRKTGRRPSRQHARARKNLCHKDPFIVFQASLTATELLADKSIYH